ncbi:MAG: hypothetical protein IJD22_02670 [Clostridia bacterium]|nr:hypothetical protein [Clostridia bacterium]
MSKNKITTSFTLFTVAGVLGCTIISKILTIVYLWAVSDITAPALVAPVCYYGSDLFSLCAVSVAIAATVYAFSYFGKKTAVRTALIALSGLACGKIMMYVYNVIVNTLSAPKLIPGALSYFIEILFDGLMVTVALIFSSIFAKRRDVSQKENATAAYSPLKAALSSCGAYYAVLIVDLSIMNVIPFFIKYSDPTENEIRKIIADYLFYVFSAAIAMLFISLVLFILRKITGKLKLKQYYAKKS